MQGQKYSEGSTYNGQKLQLIVKIMVTGYLTLKNAVESQNYGAKAYIIKPIQPEVLFKVIKAKLQK